MTDLSESLSNVTRHIDYSDEADIPGDVYDLLSALVERVEHLSEGLQNLRELMAMRGPQAPAEAMSRADALQAAREHVKAMATTSRGYPDGSLADRVAAVERFARFLMGEAK